jgi:hypothetical protein
MNHHRKMQELLPQVGVGLEGIKERTAFFSCHIITPISHEKKDPH